MPPATSQPKQARSRKAAATQSQQAATGRSGSAGGIVLENEATGNSEASLKSAVNAKHVTVPPPIKKMNATTPTKSDEKGSETVGANRPKRRPRKLNKEPAPDKSTATATPPAAPVDPTSSSAAVTELEALKSRVRGLEAKVEELYSSAEARSGRSPRRRGKRKGSSTTQVPTVASAAGPTPVDGEDEVADEELERLEDELEDARRDLMMYQPRNQPHTTRSTSGDTEYVEETPREGNRTVTTGDRQVTLSGSYRIPLPSNLSMDDVKSIQNGVSAAQNVAKSFLDQRRAAQASRNPTPPAASRPASKAAPQKSSAPAAENSKENNSKTWGEWFGGYSVAISKAIKTIEAEAAIESQGAPETSTARTGRASSSKKPPSMKSTARPSVKGRQGNLSDEQVRGLMG